MATGDTFLALANKRLLGFQDFGERFFNYQQKQIQEANQRAFGQDGFFGGTQVTMSAYSGSRVQINNDVEGADNAGNFLTTDAKLAGRDVGLAFQNTNSVTYSVAMHHATRPRGIAINPRTARPDFVAYEDTIGELHEPDAVAISGGGTTLTFDVDSVVDPFSPSAVNNAGRICAVWKKIPGEAATIEAAAVEEVAVTWSGTANQVITTSLLGQVDPSTIASDYLVLMIGPTIVRQSIEDLADTAGYLFVAELVGGSPPGSFDYSKQNDLGVGFAVALDQITRIGTNGDLKLSVQAHPSDSSESQIQVVDSSGSPVNWTVDEDGNMETQGEVTAYGQVFLLNGPTGLYVDSKIDTEDLETAGTLNVASGVLRISSGASLDVQSSVTAQFASTPEFGAGIAMEDKITWDGAETAPGIIHEQLAGIGNPGADGATFPLEVQQGQRGAGTPGGDGATLELGMGRPGIGTPDGAPGKLVKKWGDSAGYKWFEWEWCTGEVAYSTTAVYPITVPIDDGEIHIVEVDIFARDVAGGTTTKLVAYKSSFQRTGSSVTEGGQATSWGPVGAADVTFTFDAFINAYWRVAVVSGASSGDCVVFARWRVASLDGV